MRLYVGNRLRTLRWVKRGFTLVELMMVVAIVGVLGSLANYGVRKYTAASKSVEALNAVGAIARSVRMAADRDLTSSSVLALGTTSAVTAGSTGTVTGGGANGNGKGATVTHGGSIAGMCDTSEPVPASMNSIKGKKYQPKPSDYATGDSITGWRCLMFTSGQPQYYQYRYRGGTSPPVSVKLPHGGSPRGLTEDRSWMATAQGDLDGDGVTSWFVLEGVMDLDGSVTLAPAIGTDQPEE